jgi:hypothetical protein
MAKIVSINVEPISQRDQSIITIKTDVDYRGKPSIDALPAVQLQMPTDIARQIQEHWEFWKDSEDDKP